MATATLSRPLVPEDMGLRQRRPSDHLVRAILCAAHAAVDPQRRGAADVAGRLFKNDRATLEIVTRAATVPATTTGWASELAATAISDLIVALGPASAGGELIKLGLNLEFNGARNIQVPTIISTATDVPFVEEGQPDSDSSTRTHGPDA